MSEEARKLIESLKDRFTIAADVALELATRLDRAERWIIAGGFCPRHDIYVKLTWVNYRRVCQVCEASQRLENRTNTSPEQPPNKCVACGNSAPASLTPAANGEGPICEQCKSQEGPWAT